MKSGQCKRKFVVPHTLVILFAIVVIVALLTYIVPAGEFERELNEATGKTMVVPGTYHPIEQSPVSPLRIPVILFNALVDASDMIFFVLLIGGSFGIITNTGSVTLFSKKAALFFKGKEKYAIFPFTLIFAILGATMGFGIEGAAFISMGVTFAYSLGYDRLVGYSIVGLGGLVGSTAGVLNPFNVGIAQSIAELPMFSGALYRTVIMIALLVVTSVYVVRYAERVKKDPSKGLLYGEKDDTYIYDAGGDENDNIKMDAKHYLVLADIVIGLIVLVWGSATQGWSFAEMSGLFLVMGLITGIIMRYSPNRIAQEFSAGVKDIAASAIIIGLARAIQLVMNEGFIIDTVINALSTNIQYLPQPLRALGMYIAQIFTSMIIVSSSGQAVAIMPIMIPLADLAGVSRQTAVLAFQLGDGFTNYILPTCTALFVTLSVAKITYEKWLKFFIPLFGIWVAMGGIFVVIATLIGY